MRCVMHRTASEIWVCLQVRDKVCLINDGPARRVNEHSIRFHHLQCSFVDHAGSGLVEDSVEADNVTGFQNFFDRVKLSTGDLLAAIFGVHASSIRHACIRKHGSARVGVLACLAQAAQSKGWSESNSARTQKSRQRSPRAPDS